MSARTLPVRAPLKKRATLRQIAAMARTHRITHTIPRWDRIGSRSALFVLVYFDLDSPEEERWCLVRAARPGETWVEDEQAAEDRAARIASALRDEMLCPLIAEGAYRP